MGSKGVAAGKGGTKQTHILKEKLGEGVDPLLFATPRNHDGNSLMDERDP